MTWRFAERSDAPPISIGALPDPNSESYYGESVSGANCFVPRDETELLVHSKFGPIENGPFVETGSPETIPGQRCCRHEFYREYDCIRVKSSVRYPIPIPPYWDYRIVWVEVCDYFRKSRCVDRQWTCD